MKYREVKLFEELSKEYGEEIANNMIYEASFYTKHYCKPDDEIEFLNNDIDNAYLGINRTTSGLLVLWYFDENNEFIVKKDETIYNKEEVEEFVQKELI